MRTFKDRGAEVVRSNSNNHNYHNSSNNNNNDDDNNINNNSYQHCQCHSMIPQSVMTSFCPLMTRLGTGRRSASAVTCLLFAVLLAPSGVTSACPTRCACFTGTDGNVVSCRHQTLDRVPPDLPTDIVELDMGHCQIRKLDKGTFPALPNLRRLVLDWCGIKRIEEHTFSGLPNVEYVKLSHNVIGHVDPLAFRGLAGLRSLHLDNNRIRVLPNALFSRLRLDELLLNNNSIQSLDDRVFEDSSVVSLNLDVNNISNISIELFTPLRKSLKNFNLSHNEQPLRLATDVFSGFHFSDLKISYDGLRDPSFLKHVRAYSLDISGHQFGELNFADCVNFRSLNEIYLRSLGIEILNESILVNLASVVLLDLSDNRLYDIDGDVFAYTPRLRVLRLDRNRFVSLPENLGIRLGRLQVLKVPQNKLAMIRPDAFSGMASLRELDIRDNQIQVVQESMRRRFSLLETIRMAGNPLHCNCEMRWYRDWIERSGKDTGAFRCRSPEERSISNMTPSDFVCQRPNITFVTGSMNAERGSSVYLTCAARGDPAPEVEWSSPFGEFVSVTPPFDRTKHVTYAIWHVSGVQKYQAGWYTCKARNVEGSTDKSVYINVYEPGDVTIDVSALTPPTSSTTSASTTTTTMATTTTSTTTTTTTATTTTTTTTTATTTTTTTTPTTTITSSTTAVATTTTTSLKAPSVATTPTAMTYAELPETTIVASDKEGRNRLVQSDPDVPTWAIIVIVISVVGAILLTLVVSVFVYRMVNRKYKQKYDVSADRDPQRSKTYNQNIR